MNKKRQMLFTAILAAGLVFPVASANALVINFYNGANLYAKMTTSNSTSFDLYFVGAGVSASGFINELFMDGPAGTFTNNSVATSASGTYSLNGFNGGGGGGNVYDWKIDFPNANNASRLTVGEHGLWSITTTANDAWNLNKIHINSFDGTNSIKLNGCIEGANCGGGGVGSGRSSSVPEPATLALVGLGLMGARLSRRRRTS